MLYMNSHSVFEWKSPPSASRVDRWSREAGEKLRERPGEWALVKTYTSGNSARTMAGHIKAGRMVGFEAGQYEAVGRRQFDTATGQMTDQWEVFARYVGHLDV